MERKKLALVSLGHLSCDINGGALPACLPYLRAAHALDFQATAGFMLAYSSLSSLIQPLFGLLADRHKKPWFIPLGVLLGGLGLALMGFMAGYWAIFACIALSGIGSAFFHPEGARYANRVSGSHKGAGMSLFSIGGNAGFILGPLIVALFVGNFGLAGMGVFGVLAIIMACILIWQIHGVTSLKPTPASKVQARFAAGDPAAAEGDELAANSAPKKEVVNNWRGFSRLVVVILCRSIVFVGCNTFIPLYWVNGLGQSAGAGATALVVFGAAGVAFNIVGGMLSDRIGYVPVIRIAFCLMGPAAFFFALTGNVWANYLLLPLLALSLYLPYSAQVVLGQNLLAKNIGFASGVTLGLSTTVGGMMQPVFGFIADQAGLGMVFMTLAGFGLLGAIFSFILKKGQANA